MIKTKQIKTAKATILIIDGLPEDADRFKFFNGERPYLSYFIKNETFREYNMPLGKWESVGFLKDIPEDVAKELVDKYGKQEFHPNWTAKKALLSLVAANCKLENKYGDCPTPVDYEDDPFGMASAVRRQKIGKWQAEEETVFRNPFLLNKID